MEGNLTFAGESPNGILFNSETTLSGNSTSDGATIYYERDNLVIEKKKDLQEMNIRIAVQLEFISVVIMVQEQHILIWY